MIKVETTSGDGPEEGISAEAFFSIDGNKLHVYFDTDRRGTMELEGDNEVSLMRQLLSDPNLWSQFFGSLSVALKEHR